MQHLTWLGFYVCMCTVTTKIDPQQVPSIQIITCNYNAACQTSKTYLSLVTEALYPFTSISPFTPPPSAWQPVFYSVLLRVQLVQIPQKSEIIQQLSFCVWFISLSVMSPSFTHVVQMAGFLSFLWLNNIPLYIYHIFFIRSSIDRHIISMCCLL